jgi:hypothetical protein
VLIPCARLVVRWAALHTRSSSRRRTSTLINSETLGTFRASLTCTSGRSGERTQFCAPNTSAAPSRRSSARFPGSTGMPPYDTAALVQRGWQSGAARRCPVGPGEELARAGHREGPSLGKNTRSFVSSIRVSLHRWGVYVATDEYSVGAPQTANNDTACRPGELFSPGLPAISPAISRYGRHAGNYLS